MASTQVLKAFEEINKKELTFIFLEGMYSFMANCNFYCTSSSTDL